MQSANICQIRGLPMVGTESRKRKRAQKSHGSLEEHFEKLFRRGCLAKGVAVALGNALREGEVILTPRLFACCIRCILRLYSLMKAS